VGWRLAPMGAFHEQLGLVSDTKSIVMVWPDAKLNKIGVTLNPFDLDSIRRLYEAVPGDVLVVSVHPGVHAELLGGGRRTSKAG
jgi:hypothetical protein